MNCFPFVIMLKYNYCEKVKEILLKIDTEVDKIIKIFGVDTLKEFEYVRPFEVVSFYINQSNSILYIFVK